MDPMWWFPITFVSGLLAFTVWAWLCGDYDPELNDGVEK